MCRVMFHFFRDVAVTFLVKSFILNHCSIFKYIKAVFRRGAFVAFTWSFYICLGSAANTGLSRRPLEKAFPKSRCLTFQLHRTDKPGINLVSLQYATGDKLLSLNSVSPCLQTTIRALYFVIISFSSRFLLKKNFLSNFCSFSGPCTTFQLFILCNMVISLSLALQNLSARFPFNTCLVLGQSSPRDRLRVSVVKPVGALIRTCGYCCVLFSCPTGSSRVSSVEFCCGVRSSGFSKALSTPCCLTGSSQAV